MRYLIIILILALLPACTTTYVKRTDGLKTFEAGNTSIGWDREDVRFDLLKKPDKLSIGIGIGKSSGRRGLDRVIKGLENTLETLKSMRP